MDPIMLIAAGFGVLALSLLAARLYPAAPPLDRAECASHLVRVRPGAHMADCHELNSGKAALVSVANGPDALIWRLGGGVVVRGLDEVARIKPATNGIRLVFADPATPALTLTGPDPVLDRVRGAVTAPARSEGGDAHAAS